MDKLAKLHLLRTSNFPRQRIERFYNQPLFLVRSGKQLGEKELCFRCNQDVTKPEIKQLLEKLYGLDVESVHTWNKIGSIRKNNVVNHYCRKPDFKKVIVQLKTTVPAHLQNFYY